MSNSEAQRHSTQRSAALSNLSWSSLDSEGFFEREYRGLSVISSSSYNQTGTATSSPIQTTTSQSFNIVNAMLQPAILSVPTSARKTKDWLKSGSVEAEKRFKQKGQLTVMPKIDVLDEAIIDSPPVVVYKAILNEYAGVTRWWMPRCELKPRGNKPVDREGAIVEVTIHTSATPKFSIKITKVVEAKSVEMEFAGDFVGTGKLTLEPTDGKTKVQYRWNVRPKRLSFVLLSPFIDMGKVHSETMQIGFKACNSYLNKK